MLLSEATVNALTPDEVATMSSPDNEYPVDGLYGPIDDIEIAFRSPFYGIWEYTSANQLVTYEADVENLIQIAESQSTLEPVYYLFALLSRPNQPDSQKFILQKAITFEIYDSSQVCVLEARNDLFASAELNEYFQYGELVRMSTQFNTAGLEDRGPWSTFLQVFSESGTGLLQKSSLTASVTK